MSQQSGPAVAHLPPSLAEAAGAGHPDLLRLYEEQRPYLLALCLSYVGHRSDAEDAVHETFLKAAPHLHRVAGDARGYLTATARSVCCDELRRRGRLQCEAEPASAVRLTADGPERDVLDRDQVRRAWRHLSAPERTLLALSFAGYSYPEIAERTGRSVGAVTMTLIRARRRMRWVVGTPVPVLVAMAARTMRRHLVRRAPSKGLAAAPASGGALPVGLLTVSLVTAVVVGAGSPAAAPARGGASTAGVPVAVAPALPVQPVGALPSPAGADGERLTSRAVATPTPRAVATPPLRAVLDPYANAQPGQARVQSETASPSYHQDHTVFASGVLLAGCDRRACPILFESNDGGASWRPHASVGFAGGTVLVPAAHDGTRVLFATGPSGLQESRDDGDTWLTVAPVSGPAALVPTSSGGEQVLVGSVPMIVYDPATRAVTPGPVLPPGMTPSSVVAVGGVHGTIVAVNPATAGAPGAASALMRCSGQPTCTPVMSAPYDGGLMAAVSSTVGTDGTVVAYDAHHVYVSRDGGTTFSSGTLPVRGSVTAVGVASVGTALRIVATAFDIDAGGRPTATLLTTGAGAVALVASPHLPPSLFGFASLLQLGDGTLLGALAGPVASGAWGLACSHDGGVTWQVTC